MKYLFLLLMLTGCGVPKKKIQRPAPAVSNSLQTSDFDNYDEEYGESFLEPVSEQEIKIYLSDLNKHRASYEEFFQKQLVLHGRDTNGNILVDIGKLWVLSDQYGFILTGKIVGKPGEEKVVLNKIVVIEHGKTNYYSVPK